MKKLYPFTAVLGLWLGGWASASAQATPTDSLRTRGVPTLAQQRDVLDVVKAVLPRFPLKGRDTVALANGRKYTWLLPNVGYSLQTRFLLQLFGNLAFRNEGANVSTIVSSLTYTQNSQAIFSVMPNVWLAGNRYNLVGDFRVMRYPQGTFGLGRRQLTARQVQMDYKYLRAYPTLLRRVARNLYAGPGYLLDYHWDIRSEYNSVTLETISRYPYGVAGQSVSSGLSLNLLYDSRANAINPGPSFYANVSVRGCYRWLGSDQNYPSLFVDVRKYVSLPRHSDNILAFWSHNDLTLAGNPPFLDLPSTGWDTYGNLGRGYIQGRFRGKNLLYAEVEYRFAILRNRLLGGVVFANAQSVSAQPDRVRSVVPAAGVGLRVKMNKYSRTSLAIDYGWGAGGSRGLFFNLGEVF